MKYVDFISKQPAVDAPIRPEHAPRCDLRLARRGGRGGDAADQGAGYGGGGGGGDGGGGGGRRGKVCAALMFARVFFSPASHKLSLRPMARPATPGATRPAGPARPAAPTPVRSGAAVKRP